MKLRIKGNSVRYRVARSEVARLIDSGRIEETIYFAPGEGSKLTYALEQSPRVASTELRYEPPDIVIVVPAAQALDWAGSDQVGIYATVHLGLRGALDLIVEKDFACLDLSDADNIDTFPNPNLGTNC